ncbi:hypothetical protein [Corynebacterium epidermidicanis]|uniref:Uncharacterized protein n=1 Tax=Corynebacterium epidermidicanis TaxID=1050174 RepID=A0A0G3GR03_9CORY|nr:hypothetical protein [Corynebacterium epidermidicanis]AKK02003.1 hypothetical protein CEPID_00545 [Corynebacterium epidermidicanis]
MKVRLCAPLLAVGMMFGVPAVAHAQVAEVEETVTQSFGFYSAMSDYFSCTYYPTRPWCPNPFG